MTKIKTIKQEAAEESQDLDHREERAKSEIDIHKDTETAIQAETAPENIRRLIKMMDPIAVSLPNEPEALWEYTVHQLNESTASKAKAGLALMMLKERLGHGDYLKELDVRDIPARTAQDSIKVATMLLRLPASNARTFAHLGGSKLIELARLPEETLQEISENDLSDSLTLDEADRMSVRELRQAVRQLKQKHKDDHEANERLLAEKDKKINDLDKQLNQKPSPDEVDIVV